MLNIFNHLIIPSNMFRHIMKVLNPNPRACMMDFTQSVILWSDKPAQVMKV
jgi:hypothetical protein